jgi:DNA modification methylase
VVSCFCNLEEVEKTSPGCGTSSRVIFIVLDATAGSGSTLIAAQQCNRCFIGIEKESKYVIAFYERLHELQALKEAE